MSIYKKLLFKNPKNVLFVVVILRLSLLVVISWWVLFVGHFLLVVSCGNFIVDILRWLFVGVQFLLTIFDAHFCIDH